jgi:hypothetical protein
MSSGASIELRWDATCLEKSSRTLYSRVGSKYDRGLEASEKAVLEIYPQSAGQSSHVGSCNKVIRCLGSLIKFLKLS